MLANVSTRRLMAYETKRLLYFNCLMITFNDLFLEIPRTEKKNILLVRILTSYK